MGDLCSHINILYDETIEKNFSEHGSPYSVSQKKITTMKLVNKTEKDLSIKEIPYNFSKLYEFDPCYWKRVKL
jgi:hypothetical protein